jgi:RHS repeat-associated protein
MYGRTINYAYWPMPGGGTLLEIGNSGADYYLHKDWLGNARISTSVAGHALVADNAFSPYGETYNVLDSTNQNQQMFTGLTQNVLSGMWDTPNRELAPQGRWLSPDPAGQGWNQYAYATNPNSLVDPTGLGVVGGGGFHQYPVGNPWYMVDIFEWMGIATGTVGADAGSNPCANGCSSSRDTQEGGIYFDGGSLGDAQANVVQQIMNFNQIVTQETDQVIQAFESGGNVPTSLQNDLNVYMNPPGGLATEELMAQQGAYTNIQNYFAGQLTSQIQTDVSSIIATSTRQDLLAFSGLLTQEGINNQPGALDNAAQQAGKWAVGKALSWAAGEFAGAAQWVFNALTPTPATTALTQQTQSAINQALNP